MSIFNPKAKDTDFMSELEAAHNMRPNRAAILLFVSIIALVTCVFFWMAHSKVEELTRAQGQVVPSQDIQVIQSLEGGVLEALNVKEGQQVKKGDVLLRISDVQFSSEERGTEAKSLSLRAKKARLESEAHGKELKLPQEVLEKTPQIAANEKSLYQSRQNELKNTYAILDDRISRASADL